MATKRINGIALLRRDTESNYEKVATKFIPENGEICLVDTSTGLRAKVGDGIHFFKDLSYTGGNNDNIVLDGYFFNNKFYTDSTYTQEITGEDKHIYINKNSKGSLFFFNNGEYEAVNPEATDNVAGIMKLYQTYGQNTDGTISQKIITDGMNAIKLELDGSEEECLVLDLPWN